MNKRTILIVAALAVVEVLTSFSTDAKADGAKKPGLIGGQFGSEDFANLQSLSRLDSLELKLTDNDGYGSEWSARWFGFVVAPANGEIAFVAEGNQAMEMRIG